MSENGAVRPMVEGDLDAIAEIEQQVTPHPWNRKQFEDSFLKHHCLSMVLGDQVVGYAVFTLVAGESEILNIAIGSQWQGRGLGSQLLNALIERISGEAEHLFLEVRADNYPAQTLYQNAGLVEICVRKNYYRTADGPKDAIIMAIDFSFRP
ncbi:ribosomal protein S18-alanine N-acetyltransferase [Porticoccus sp.]